MNFLTFSVSKINGTITMKRGVPTGIFEFKVEVHDFKVFTEKNATATIRVKVTEISDEAVFRSGSVRLSGRKNVIIDEDILFSYQSCLSCLKYHQF